MPELHVIAAGSSPDFALREFEFSMPVGRIEFLHLHRAPVVQCRVDGG
jgi:hypothetical protein